MKVKICGITSLEDALAAAEAGADMLGFNFYSPSPRFIPPRQAARLVMEIKKLHTAVITVGVFVNASVQQITAIMEETGLDLAQLSGDEPPDSLSALKNCAFKALRPKDSTGLQQYLLQYKPFPGAPAYLVDAFRPGQYGGTGATADWSLARSLAQRYPVLLAGGLTPENVREAVSQVSPWGVDVASGVESSPGHKDQAITAAFIEAVKKIEKQEDT